MDVRADAGNVVGNHYDKYQANNPIVRRLMRGFLDAATSLYGHAAPTTVLEVGCGEGELATRLLAHHRKVFGQPPERFEATDVDLSQLVGGLADDLDPAITTREASIYALPYDEDEFDLVVCCEVLEHLRDPAAGLAELARVAKTHVLLSTPWEPVWRALNLARGKYIFDLGNTPGHVQHFSRRDLENLAATRLTVTARRTPLPWTMLLGRPHS